MLVKIMPPEDTSKIAYYRASTGNSSCEVLANASSFACLIGGLPAGSQFEVETVACLSNGICSSPVISQGYTLPDGMLEHVHSFYNQTKAKLYIVRYHFKLL